MFNQVCGVWRSENPCFEPPAGAVSSGTVDASTSARGDPLSFIDDGTVGPAAPILGDASHNHYWLCTTEVAGELRRHPIASASSTLTLFADARRVRGSP